MKINAYLLVICPEYILISATLKCKRLEFIKKSSQIFRQVIFIGNRVIDGTLGFKSPTVR